VNKDIPKNAVVVVQCPDCSEWAVCFQNKICALDRKVLEAGTSRERKLHLAKIIAEFLEPMLSRIGLIGLVDQANSGTTLNLTSGEDDESAPISDKEMRDFIHFDLKRLDNPEYFRRHLG
jgi:hypothetical protein